MCVSESIFSGVTTIIPMADVQHMIKKGTGLIIITKHTTWDMEADTWSNSIWLDHDEAAAFRKAWCYYRYELDGPFKGGETDGVEKREG